MITHDDHRDIIFLKQFDRIIEILVSVNDDAVDSGLDDLVDYLLYIGNAFRDRVQID